MKMSLPHFGLLYFCLFYSIFKSSAEGYIPNILFSDNAVQMLSDDYKYTYDLEAGNNKVDVKLYYEVLCPDCIDFDTTQFEKVVKLLSEYLNIHTYPYGNARTIETNGTFQIICQHGEEECYGNMLHACALNLLSNNTQALLYNSCMMTRSQKGHGSDDASADRCGASMNIDSKPIKECAKSEMGRKLLKKYGEESKKANFNYVPYILINGEVYNGTDFMKDVCKAFASPPPPCEE